MSLETIVYSVLIVSSSETFNNSALDILPVSHYQPIHFSSSINEAKRNLSERNYDLIIINAPLPDETGVKFAIDTSSGKSTVCLLFVRAELYEETRSKVSSRGVFTLPKPTSSIAVMQGLSFLVSARERLRNLEKKTLSIEEKMEEIRLVNRAKWLLIDNLNLTEADAHRYIEKQAMDARISKRQMAENVIKTYE